MPWTTTASLIRSLFWLLAFLLAATALAAQEYIATRGQISDEDFYRVVACAAPPGGDCGKEFVRWAPRDARNLTVAIVAIEDGFPARLAARIDQDLDRAIAELNAAGADLQLSRVKPGKKADVSLFLQDIPFGGTIRGTGLSPLDGTRIEIAWTQIWWRGDKSLYRCAVVFSSDLEPGDSASVVLEELTQCLGLITDIGGRYYESRSVFSESSNSVTRLGEQDKMAIRRHYP